MTSQKMGNIETVKKMYELLATKDNNAIQQIFDENIKWNGPNYCFYNEDRITMRIQQIQPTSTKQIQVIFHRGAKKQVQPKDKLIAIESKLLIWKENDRAIVTFKSLQDIKNDKTELTTIINEWINATK